MQKAVIFDLDGTLVDSIRDIHLSLNTALTKFGYKKISVKKLRDCIGYGARELVARASNNDISSQVVADMLAFYNKTYADSKSPNTGLFKGMGKVLIELKKRGYILAILTNKPQPNTDLIYNSLLAQYEFSIVMGQSDKIKCKPDKTATENILSSLSVEKQNAYFIGDGETDVLTSINAQVNHVAVLWGYRKKEHLKSVGATNFAKRPKDLLKILK